MPVNAAAKVILHEFYVVKYSKEQAPSELHSGVLLQLWNQRAIVPEGTIAGVWNAYANDKKAQAQKDKEPVAAAREVDLLAEMFQRAGFAVAGTLPVDAMPVEAPV